MLKRESGFTLVEIVIVMAIALSLAVVILSGQGALRRQAQFTDAVESFKNELTAARNSANSTVNENGDGTDDDRTVFGRAVVINNATSSYTTALILDDNGTKSVESSTNKTVPWNVTVSTPSMIRRYTYIVFARSAGNVVTYGFASDSDLNTVISDNTNFSSPLTALSLQLLDSDGRKAKLDIAGANGLVTRTFQ